MRAASGVAKKSSPSLGAMLVHLIFFLGLAALPAPCACACSGSTKASTSAATVVLMLIFMDILILNRLYKPRKGIRLSVLSYNLMPGTA